MGDANGNHPAKYEATGDSERLAVFTIVTMLVNRVDALIEKEPT
jgi:hypothetical protein